MQKTLTIQQINALTLAQFVAHINEQGHTLHSTPEHYFKPENVHHNRFYYHHNNLPARASKMNSSEIEYCQDGGEERCIWAGNK